MPVEIIGTERPKSSDREIDRRLDEVVIIGSIGEDCTDRIEVIGVGIAASYRQIESLQKSLTQACADVRFGKILAAERRVVSSARASQSDLGRVRKLVIGRELKDG